MTLTQLFQKIEDGTYSINNKQDSTEIKKYYFDIDEDNRKIISKKYIKKWDVKKSKLSDDESLQILEDYLKTCDKKYYVKKIHVAGQYEFEYIKCKENNIREENIFKLNFLNIVQKLNEYFSNVKILIEFEAPTTVDSILKKQHCTYKHDVLIKIQPNKDEVDNDEIFEVVLEYFEKIHNKFNDDDKKIATNLFSDAYFVFSEKSDNIEDFMIDTIYRIIELICACTENKFELSKILYFNKNYKKNSINKDIMDFNNIIDIKKNKNFNLKKLYDELQPINPDTGDDFDFKEFIEYIEENYNDDGDDKKEFNFNNVDNIYASEIFEKLILYLNIDISNERLKRYKHIYIKAVDTLFIAATRILEIMKEHESILPIKRA
jgi:hypothetical protein